MRITCTYRGKQIVKENSEADFMFGRAEEKFPLGLDLTPDVKVSRLHGRIWFENDAWWIEDRNSSRGTRLNDRNLRTGPTPSSASRHHRSGDGINRKRCSLSAALPAGLPAGVRCELGTGQPRTEPHATAD